MNLAIIGLVLGIINLCVPMNDLTKILFHEDIVNIVHLPITHAKKNFDTVFFNFILKLIITNRTIKV